jgi:hypothetical protein
VPPKVLPEPKPEVEPNVGGATGVLVLLANPKPELAEILAAAPRLEKEGIEAVAPKEPNPLKP